VGATGLTCGWIKNQRGVVQLKGKREDLANRDFGLNSQFKRDAV
jgi:hypothetical protein